MVQCPTCGGTYAPVLADGYRYFHRCSPMVLDAKGVPKPRAVVRDENVPPPAPLAALIAVVPVPNDPQYWQKVNAIAETATLSVDAPAVALADAQPAIEVLP